MRKSINKRPLTEPQARALRKWEDGKDHNNVAMGVRSDVCQALHDKGMIERRVLLHDRITDRGREALKDYYFTL